MADDADVSSPWGRPGGAGPRGGASSGVAPATPPAGAPHAGPSPEGQVWTPPPSTPVPGGAPFGPGSSGAGLSGRALVALIAVVVMALVAVGLGVFFVASGDDDGEVATEETRPAGATEPVPEETPGSEPEVSEPTASVDIGEPGETGPGSSLDLSGTVPGLSPEAGTEGLAPPEGFPQPEGTVPDTLTGGLTVPGTAADALAFYEGALPGAGYAVEPSELPGVAAVLAVTGDGVTGQLVFLDLGLGSTSVVWVAG